MRWPLVKVAVAERSMEPALHSGDWLLVLRTRRIRPGQIVLARHPGKPDMFLVKRATRLMPDGGWWLSSDNPDAGAVDSRHFGPVSAIEGRVLFRYRRSLPQNGPWYHEPVPPLLIRRDRSGTFARVPASARRPPSPGLSARR